MSATQEILSLDFLIKGLFKTTRNYFVKACAKILECAKFGTKKSFQPRNFERKKPQKRFKLQWDRFSKN